MSPRDVGGRRSAFPNVWIDSIEVEQPPFDKEGVIQEFVGEGVIRDFDILQPADETPPVMIKGMLAQFEGMVGPLKDNFRMKYNLIVRTTPSAGEDIFPDEVLEFGNWIRKRRVRTAARTFVRAKNPFEPELVRVSEPEENDLLSDEELGTFWNVTATVTK